MIFDTYISSLISIYIFRNVLSMLSMDVSDLSNEIDLFPNRNVLFSNVTLFATLYAHTLSVTLFAIYLCQRCAAKCNFQIVVLHKCATYTMKNHFPQISIDSSPRRSME